jgi:hypothetical protein
VIGFIGHFNTRLVTALNYCAIADHNLQLTTAHSKPSKFVTLSPSRSMVTASNTGDSSASELMSLRSGEYSTTQLLPPVDKLPGWRPSHTNLQVFASHTPLQLTIALSLILRPTVSRPVCLGIKHPSGAYRPDFYYCQTVAGLLMCGALSDEKAGLPFTITDGPRHRNHIRAESHGSRDHILLSQILDLPFRRLLRLAGLRWRYSTPPPHGMGGV